MATRKGEAARNRILAAAWDEIDDLGVEQLLAGVSIRDVAARAGVAPSSVTYHFGTTAELADAMADWLLERSTMAPLTDLEGVEDVILAHAGNLADAIRMASDLNWARLTSDEEQDFARRVMRLFAATGSTVDGERMSDRLNTRYWGSFLPEVAALYDRVLGRLGLHWVEPFEAETLARMGPSWLIQQWMVDRSVRSTLYGDIVVGLMSAITAPVARSQELAELEVRLPALPVDPLGMVEASARELADVEEQRELAAAAAPLFVERFDDVTMTEVARMMGHPVREVAARFGTVRRVAAVSFFRHVGAVEEAATRRAHMDPLLGVVDLMCELARRVQGDRQCARALLAERLGAELVAPRVSEIDDVRFQVPIGPLLFSAAAPVTDLSPDGLYEVTALMIDTLLGYAMTRPDAAPAHIADVVMRLLPKN